MSNLAFEIENEISTLTNNPAGHLSSDVVSTPFTVTNASGAQNVFTTPASGPIGITAAVVADAGNFGYTGPVSDLNQIVLTSAGVYQLNANVDFTNTADVATTATFNVGINGLALAGSTTVAYTGSTNVIATFVGEAADIVTVNAFSSEAGAALTVAGTSTFNLVKLA